MPASRTINLMLVDDHPVMRAGLANLLALQKDFRVVAQADDGESAIALWQQHRPDVCLLDVSMHGIDGIETMRRLRGSLPATWTWSIRPSPADTAAVTTDEPHSGRQCLRIEGIPDEANATKEEWARLPGVRGADVAVEPGAVYRLVAWLRAAEAATPVEIGFTAHKPQTYHWVELRRFVVSPEWSRHEVIVRVPEGGSPVIDNLYLRFRLAREQGVMFVDDVELHRIEPLDEWAAWQTEGWDRHSLVADPLFMAAEKDDYRLRDDSPARRLGLTSGPPESIRPPAGPAGRSPRL